MARTKRRATGAQDDVNGSTAKKARSTTHLDAQALVKAVLAKQTTYPILDDPDAVRRQFVQLAHYARDLEGELQATSQAGQASGSGSGSGPATMTPDQLQTVVAKLRKAASSGIKKQMSWKLSCKTGSAKWVYDGVCHDLLVFGTLLGLDGPPKFKMHKMPVDDFNALLGPIEASARYSNLYLTGSHVNVRWSDGGEFKFSGTYGVYQVKST